MTEQRQNEVCCKIAGRMEVRLCAEVGQIHWHCFVLLSGDGIITRRTLPFTHPDCPVSQLRLLRDGIIKSGHWIDFVESLTDITGTRRNAVSFRWVEALMQATPAQQVEAALRALGKWEETGTE